MILPPPEPVTPAEIKKLTHKAKVAFAARCARIIWQLWSEELRNKLPPEVEKGLLAAEYPEKAPRVQHEADALMRSVRASASQGTKGNPAAAILPALEMALAESLATIPDDAAAKKADQKAAKEAARTAAKKAAEVATAKAYQAFDNALHAARMAQTPPPGKIKDDFLKQARDAWDCLFKHPELLRGNRDVRPEDFVRCLEEESL
jgi:hypothetical protein